MKLTFAAARRIAATTALIVMAAAPLALARAQGADGAVQGGLDKIKDNFDTSGEVSGSQTVGDLIVGVINVLLGLLLAVSVLFIIVGGYQYITSRGNEDQAKQGRRTLTYAIIGLIVVVLSFTIVNAVANTVQTSK